MKSGILITHETLLPVCLPSVNSICLSKATIIKKKFFLRFSNFSMRVPLKDDMRHREDIDPFNR